MTMTRSPASMRAMAVRLFPDGPPLWRLLQHWRPAIAPFHVLMDEVPQGASILDVGCGGGLFLMLLAGEGRIAQGLGFDASSSAIGLAQHAARSLPGQPVRFETRAVGEPWPDGIYDVVSIIDLLHHISDPTAQADVIRLAARRIRPGGLLLLKDMTEMPLWRVAGSVIHDLVLARQWIRIPRRAEMIGWARAEGLILDHERTDNMLWYGHHLLVFRKPGDAS